jgi:hypothetical protein
MLFKSVAEFLRSARKKMTPGVWRWEFLRSARKKMTPGVWRWRLALGVWRWVWRWGVWQWVWRWAFNDSLSVSPSEKSHPKNHSDRLMTFDDGKD